MPITLSGSLSLTGSVVASGNLTTTGTITAQTLVVQTITSSINYITGSSDFGSLQSNRHTFTGSFYQTGSTANFSNCVIIGSALSGTNATFTGQTCANNNLTAAGIIYGRTTNNFPTSGAGYYGIRTNNFDGERGGITIQVSCTTNTLVNALSIDYLGTACFASQICAPQLRLSGTTNMILQPSFVGSSNLRNGGAIQYSKNFTIFTDDGVNGCGFDLQYWNGSAYYPGLRLNNVSSGFANLLLLQDGGNVGINTSTPYGSMDRVRGISGIQLPTSGLAALHFASAKNGGSVAQCGAILSVNASSVTYNTFSIHLFGNATLLNGSGQSSVLSTYDMISFVKDNFGSQFCISRISSVLNNKGAGDPLLTLIGSISSNVFTLCAAVPASGQSSYNVTGYMLTGQQGGNAGSQILTVYDGSTTSIYCS